jgi:proteasome activator subunit 4
LVRSSTDTTSACLFASQLRPLLVLSPCFQVIVDSLTFSCLDWAVSLFRRVFALYENLPEEGGRKQTTGGKQEETVLKSIKSMLDVVCLHLSEPLFDLILKIVYDYATTNAKANAVRAFGQLVACLARVNPGKTLAKFMPFCVERIEEELHHGASSTRTTSSHVASPSDTTLHWSTFPLKLSHLVLIQYR